MGRKKSVEPVIEEVTISEHEVGKIEESNIEVTPEEVTLGESIKVEPVIEPAVEEILETPVEEVVEEESKPESLPEQEKVEESEVDVKVLEPVAILPSDISGVEEYNAYNKIKPTETCKVEYCDKGKLSISFYERPIFKFMNISSSIQFVEDSVGNILKISSGASVFANTNPNQDLFVNIHMDRNA